jgi:hypothetical protein
MLVLRYKYREDSVKPKHIAQNKLFFNLSSYLSELSILQFSVRQLHICDKVGYEHALILCFSDVTTVVNASLWFLSGIGWI